MTPIIIAGIIVGVGAVVLGVSGYWTKKLMDRREEGLDQRTRALVIKENCQDLREEELDEREEKLARTEAGLTRVVYEIRGTEKEIAPNEETEMLNRRRAIYGCLEDARKFVSLKASGQEAGEIVLRAELWVCDRRGEIPE